MIQFPPTTQRVSMHTCPKLNTDIRNHTIANVYIHKDDPNAINQRIGQLNTEWDTERVLETTAAAAVIATTIMGFKSSKLWFLLTGFAGFFLLQHALTGWCPPLPILRKLGIRTAEEIHNEKMVLKVLRNDCSQNTGDPKQIMTMVEKQ